MTTYRKSTDCRSYRINYVFGHDACLDHRPCHTHRGYVPSSCNTCKENRRLWEPLSDSMLWWHRHLSMNCARLGGEDFWAYEVAFTSFFEVLLDTGSEAGSRSRDLLPLSHGWGSHSAASRPLAR